MPYRSSHDIPVKDVMALNTKNAKGWAHTAMVIQRDSALKLALARLNGAPEKFLAALGGRGWRLKPSEEQFVADRQDDCADEEANDADGSESTNCAEKYHCDRNGNAATE